jgi:arginine-tRNA-protein transferase
VHASSFGSYSILWQIEQAKILGLPYLYLGYYIRESEKMSYKANYQPIEGLIDDHWQSLTGS